MNRRSGWRARVLVFSVVSLVFLGAESSTSPQETFWQQTSGPIGGNVTALASDAAGGMYVGTQSGNVFQYDPARKRWEPRFLGATRDNVIAISVDSNGRVYFATPNDGVFRSASSSVGGSESSTGSGRAN